MNPFAGLPASWLFPGRRSPALTVCLGWLLTASAQAGAQPPDLENETRRSLVAACDSTGADNARCLAHLVPRYLFGILSPRISPDGDRFAYTMAEGRGTQVWLYDRTTRETRRLTHAEGARHDPVWSHDGGRIAYWVNNLAAGFEDDVHGIAVVDVGTGREWVVYQPERGVTTFHPSWTPNGRILFRRVMLEANLGNGPGDEGTGSGGASRATWIVDADGRNARPLLPGDRGYVAVSWDGRRIAWVEGVACTEVGPGVRPPAGLWVASIDGTGERCVLSIPRVAGQHLAWSPDGAFLLFAGSMTRDGRRGVHRVPVEGGLPELIGPADEVTGFGVSRLGDVALTVYRPHLRVGTVPVTGGVPSPLLHEPAAHALWPTWIPDGRSLTFTVLPLTARDPWWEGSGIAAVKIGDDGRQAGPLRHLIPGDTLAAVTGAAFSPDGSFLAALTRGGKWVTGPGYDLHRRENLGGAFVRIPPGSVEHFPGPPAWSPDGRRLAAPGSGSGHTIHLCERDPSLLPDHARYGLVVTEIDSIVLGGGHRCHQGKDAPALDGFDGAVTLPRYSPDGRLIAFGKRTWGGGRAGVYVVPAEGGEVETVAEFPSGEMLSGPEWSPNGRSVFFSAPDTTGVYRIHRVARGGGEATVLTHGNTDALQPSLSPDGRTLAVTLRRSVAELWLFPGRAGPGLTTPPNGVVGRDHSPPGIPASAVAPPLLELVLGAERSAPAIQRLWPGFWGLERSYLLLAEGADQGLLVSPRNPPPGWEPVAPEGIPTALHGRLYHARGEPARRGQLEIPTAYVDLGELAAARPAGIRARERALFAVFAGSFLEHAGFFVDMLLDPNPAGPEPDLPGGCPTREARSCAAWNMLERRILLEALDAPVEELPERLRTYAAMRWLAEAKWAGTEDRARHGRRAPLEIASYVAEQAATLAAGGDTTAYRERLVFDLAVDSTLGGRSSRRSESRVPSRLLGRGAEEQAVALLLDRLGPGWREDVAAGARLFDVLARRVGFDPRETLPVVAGAMRDHDFDDIVERAPVPVDPEPDPRPKANPYFYLKGLKAAVGNDLPVVVELPSEWAEDTSRYAIALDPGSAGELEPAPGLKIAPRPESLLLRAPGIRIELEGYPVGLLAKPLSHAPIFEVYLFPPDSVTERLQTAFATPDSSGVRIQVPGFRADLKPGVRLGRSGTTVIVRPLRPDPPDNRRKRLWRQWRHQRIQPEPDPRATIEAR